MSKNGVRARRRVGMPRFVLRRVLKEVPPAKRSRISQVLQTPVCRPPKSDAAKDAFSLDLVSPSAACTSFRCVEEAVEAELFPTED